MTYRFLQWNWIWNLSSIFIDFCATHTDIAVLNYRVTMNSYRSHAFAETNHVTLRCSSWVHSCKVANILGAGFLTLSIVIRCSPLLHTRHAGIGIAIVHETVSKSFMCIVYVGILLTGRYAFKAQAGNKLPWSLFCKKKGMSITHTHS